ncbi:MAG TPA: primosomal protein N', partial [Vicinamibacterales bacterium]
MDDRLISVAVPVPALGVLTYGVPDGIDMPCAGARVVVPIGPRTLTGVVLGEAAAADKAFTIKPIKQVLDDHAFVPADVVRLTEWVSEYYLAGPGATLSAALPPHGLTSRIDRFKTVRVAALTAAGLDFADRLAAHSGESADGPKLGKRQVEAILLLKGSADGLTAPVLTERGISSAVLTKLKTLGLVTIRNDRVDRDPFEHAVSAVKPQPPRESTPDQRAALETLLPLAAAKAFHVALIHGVTGSGKTEVYLRLADAVRQSGRGVLMLVPEIALTPQVAALFRARFGAAVAIQHSGLSDGERHDQWHRIRRGDVNVVIGTRSAVFAPLANPGLIIVDEEHDTSYKQDETPRYHGRDVAIMRGKFANALVVIGSATPTIESYTNALEGRYTLVTMPKRVLERPMARVTVVSMREEIAEAGEDVVLSRPLIDAMRDRLDRGEQSLILLNRRGFATAVVCRQCTAILECPNCSISLTIHKHGTNWHGRCHYCNFLKPVPKACEKCAAPYMERVGFGTERVEVEIRKLF